MNERTISLKANERKKNEKKERRKKTDLGLN